MTTEKQDPRIGKKYRLTGQVWGRHEGKIVTVEKILDDQWSPGSEVLITNDDKGRVYGIGGKWEATPVDDDPPSPPADTRKRLREYTDLSAADAVVIAGVEFSVTRRLVNKDLCLWKNGQNYLLTDPFIRDMLVDEVRRAKRKVKEVVIRSCKYEDDGSVALGIAGGGWFRVVDVREVEE